MSSMDLNAEKIAALAVLANGIIPDDEIDGGAATVQAGAALAEKARRGINASLYLQGLAEAEAIAREQCGKSVGDLDAQEIHRVLGMLQQKSPAFFKQLRMDVSA